MNDPLRTILQSFYYECSSLTFIFTLFLYAKKKDNKIKISVRLLRCGRPVCSSRGCCDTDVESDT